ncbi:MAG: hypothetical protein O3A95_10465 [Planctomycetota bacterium]|nr:hypothetical protein [Planctomycetota bacterium]MDA1114705.1 hypothetical protein [Planctomycetota bacterium]
MFAILILTLQSTLNPVEISEGPQDWQLFPRGENGLAEIEVRGDWRLDASMQQLRLVVQSEGGAEWESFEKVEVDRLSTGSQVRPFQLSVYAPAGLVEYEAFLILKRNGVDEILNSWSHLAVGDVLIVHGQSNAVAADYYNEQLANSTDQSPWIRSFGNSGTDPGLVAADLAWHIAGGEVGGSSGFIGSWGLDLARQIVEEEGIPVAVLNGAVGGTTVAQHQRNELDPEDLNTIYGRLLYRANQSGIADRARALFWYQGESDGPHARDWLNGFKTMAADWKEDYAGLEHLWIVQVRRGCGSPSLQLRDFQRRLTHADVRMHAATANGIYGHDGCHFHYSSYVSLGAQLGPQVGHHLYGQVALADMEAPDIQSATWTDASHTALFLDFRNVSGSLQVPAGSWTTLALDDGAVITQVTAVGNRLRLDLAASSTASTVEFSGTSGNQTPWIRNQRGLALMSFMGVPIQ